MLHLDSHLNFLVCFLAAQQQEEGTTLPQEDRHSVAGSSGSASPGKMFYPHM